MVEIPYQAFYCEENVWHACRVLEALGDGGVRHAVFVTNAARTVACWAQRACPAPHEPVVWDYHVILVERQEKDVAIRDPDCVVGGRLGALQWLDATFPPSFAVTPRYRPLFRPVPASRYLEELRTNRSHMRAADGRYYRPPPPWDPPGAPEHNLEDWLRVTPDPRDPWLDLDAFRASLVSTR